MAAGWSSPKLRGGWIPWALLHLQVMASFPLPSALRAYPCDLAFSQNLCLRVEAVTCLVSVQGERTHRCECLKVLLWETNDHKWSEVKVAQSCPTRWDPMDYTVHGILQAIILEWIAFPFPFSRGSSQPRDRTQVSRVAGRFFISWTTKKALSLFLDLPITLKVSVKNIFSEATHLQYFANTLLKIVCLDFLWDKMV